MHQPSSKFPRQRELVFPLLNLAAEAGGKISSQEAYRELAARAKIPAHFIDETVTLETGQKVKIWQRYVRYVKLRAQKAGYITAADLGLWELTDEGVEAHRKATAVIHVRLFVAPDQTPVAAQVELTVGLPTVHTLHRGDARDLSWIPDNSVPLIVTSIPYFDIKRYESVDGQLADIRSYPDFIAAMQEAMREAFRVALPGARVALNVGDILRSRASNRGTHEVYPLSADMVHCCRNVGFQCLTGILWQKYQNCHGESGAGAVLGQPGMPRMVIPSGSENILLFKKPGPYATPTRETREASRISKAEWRKWVRPIWDDVPGVSCGKGHPAPWPVEIPLRLIKMFSYAGQTPDVVLDPFGGQGTTGRAAMRAGRNSLINEIAPGYWHRALSQLREEAMSLSSSFTQQQGTLAL